MLPETAYACWRKIRFDNSLLAVDTHGYTDVAVAIAKLLGFDLRPRLKALKDRHLLLSHASDIPEIWRSCDDCCARCSWPDYFVNEAFRRELLRVLNRGESVNSLKRSIYVGRVAGYQAKQHDEMQAVADALSLLAISSWPGTR